MSAAVPASKLRAFALVAGLAGAAACSPPSITSDRNPDIPIPAGATVAFRGQTSEGTTQVDPAVANDIVHSRIQQAILAQLREKGYTVVDTTQPSNFNVRYYVGVAQNTSYVSTTTGMGAYYGGYGGYGYGYGWGGYGGYYGGTAVTTTSPVTTTNVSFVVELSESTGGKTAWRGIYQGEARNSAPSQERINSLAKSIFATLPKVP